MDLPNLLYGVRDTRFDQSLFPEIHYRLLEKEREQKKETENEKKYEWKYVGGEMENVYSTCLMLSVYIYIEYIEWYSNKYRDRAVNGKETLLSVRALKRRQFFSSWQIFGALFLKSNQCKRL